MCNIETINISWISTSVGYQLQREQKKEKEREEERVSESDKGNRERSKKKRNCANLIDKYCDQQQKKKVETSC